MRSYTEIDPILDILNTLDKDFQQKIFQGMAKSSENGHGLVNMVRMDDQLYVFWKINSKNSDIILAIADIANDLDLLNLAKWIEQIPIEEDEKSKIKEFIGNHVKDFYNQI